MRIHILGICGTFMAGVALLARQLGYDVEGSDANVYPPMSTQLEAQGIKLYQNYSPKNLEAMPDLVIVGNVIKRGNPAIEYVLNEKIPYISGPAFLADHVLQHKTVLAVAGTHGKTTVSAMLAWILESAGLNPGFLIGGVPENFNLSARLTDSEYFIIEADEYDSAFFDKRSKFLHYHADILVLNNLEFDHADIFQDIGAIKTQFHHLVRTIPERGKIVLNAADQNLSDVIAEECWTPIEKFNDPAGWHAKSSDDGRAFDVYSDHKKEGSVEWPLLGPHNVENGLAAILAAKQAGIDILQSAKALEQFKNVKRRLELKLDRNGVSLYEDFAHHPTAIEKTLQGLRHFSGDRRIIVLLEFGSYTMRTGVHHAVMMNALRSADLVLIKRPVEDWGVDDMIRQSNISAFCFDRNEEMINYLKKEMLTGDVVIVMSNTGFSRICDDIEVLIENE